MKKPTILFFTIFLLSVNSFVYLELVLAQTLTENEATPSVISEIGAKLTITEVNFKNSEADWVEIHYSSPAGKPLNIKGVSFADDSAFKKISQDITIQSGQYLLLYFKNGNPDQPPYFYTSQTGLTGTTEQFIIYDRNNKVLDAVCWASSTPTTSEMADLSELYTLGGWHTPQMTSCLESEKVDTDSSIARHPNSDTNSKNDWFIAENPTPGSQNNQTSAAETKPAEKPAPLEEPRPEQEPSEEILKEKDQIEEEQEGQATSAATEETSATPKETDEPGLILEEVVTIEQPKSTATNVAKKETVPKKSSSKSTAQTTKKSTKKSSKKTAKKSSSKKPDYQNGDLSENIIISELLPNPEKDDNKNEWIELYNQGEEDVNLGNWKLDDAENGSKPHIFSDETVIKAGSTLLVPITASKLSLGNKEDSVRLFNYEEEVVNEITYEEAPNGKSYALITIAKEDEAEEQEWQWSSDPSPDSPNPSYQEISAEITNEPQFGETYFFEVKDEKNQLKEITFDEATIPGPLAKATFTKGSQIKLLLAQNDDDSYALKNYEILKAPEAAENNTLLFGSILGTITMIAGITVYVFRKKLFLRKV